MVIKRVGGKAKIADWINVHVPPYSTFVDVFGGSGSVLESVMCDHGRYVYNDLDTKVYSFFWALRHKGMELSHIVSLSPYSRQLFKECYSLYSSDEFEKLSDIDKSFVFLVVNRQCFGGKMENTWSISRTGEINYKTWNKLPKHIASAHQKWKQVYLENLDYLEILSKWDHEQTTFYLDPPYVGVEDRYYEVNKDGFDHEIMYEAVMGLSGSFCISYYDGELVRRYESAGCDVFRKTVAKHLAIADTKEIVTEALIVRKNEWSKNSVSTRSSIKGQPCGDVFL